MIKKTIILFFAFLLSYAFLLELLDPEVRPHNSAWFLEYVKAERYVLDNKEYELIVLGSSSSNRLKINNIYPNSLNLSFAGMSSKTGLKLLEKKNDFPRVILVEIDRVHVKDPIIMDEILFNPIVNFSKKSFKVFRSEYTPISFIGYWCKIIKDKIAYELLSPQTNNIKPIQIDKGAKDNLVLGQYNKGELNNKLKSKIDISVLELERLLEIFSKNGTKIYLFEMPSDGKIKKSEMRTYIRDKTKKIAKLCSYNWIPLDVSKEYTTIDGAHLTDSSAIAYFKYLNGFIN